MGSYLVVYADAAGAGAAAERLADDVQNAGGTVRFTWTGDGDFPAAALVMLDDEQMEQLARRVRDHGEHDLMWLGAGQDGTGIGGGNDSGHIKAGRGGGHIKAGHAGF